MSEEQLSTEDEILSGVEGISDGQETEQHAESTAEEHEVQTASGNNESIAESRNGVAQDQQPPAQQQRGPQDLVDANGNVIARGGKERRLYETAHKERTRSNDLQQQVTSLQGQLDAVNQAGSVGTQLGLTPEEVTTGAQIMKSYKDNPVETVKYMLPQTQAAGHNVEGITGTDVASIKQMIDDAMSPILQDRQTQIDAQTNEAEAQQTYNRFVGSYPDAPVHANSLARLLEEDQTLSPEAAYFKLKSFYAEKGLDWSKPLETLEQEARQAPQQESTQTLPQGSANVSNVTDQSAVASINTPIDDIIRQSMREAGINS